MQKTLCFVFYTVPAFLIGYFLISQEERHVKNLLLSCILFSFVILGETFPTFYTKGISTIQDVLQTNYLVTGQTLGTGLIIGITFSLFHFKKREESSPFVTSYLWILLLFLDSFYVYALVNIGGRGPVIATAGSLIFLYVLKSGQISLRTLSTHLGIFMVLSIVSYNGLNWFFDHTTSHFAERLSLVIKSENLDASISERFSYYQSAFHAFLQHPLKEVGFGGWPLFHGFEDRDIHPHNIFLEILSEAGLIGFFMFVVLLFVCFRQLDWPFIINNFFSLSILLITGFSFLNSLKTGDLHDNILFFFSLSLCAGFKKGKNF